MDDREDENRDSGTMFIGVGHARGAGLGAAFGAAFGQVALGVPRGAAVGLVAGVIASRRARAIHVVFPTARRPA